MKRFIFYLIVLFVAVWIGLQIKNDPGYALFAYQHWTVEMPLWFAALLLVVGFLVLHQLFLIMRGVGHLGPRVNVWLQHRRERRAYQHTNQGLLDLAEGKWSNAEKNLVKAVENNPMPLINYLAAARASQEQGQYEKRDDYLRLAHRCAPGGEVAVGLTQAQLQLNHKQLEQGLATLRHLQSIVPQHTHVLTLLMILYHDLADWNQLLELLPTLRKCRVINQQEIERLTVECYQGIFKQLKPESSMENINMLWKKIPRTFRQNPGLIKQYVKKLMTFGEDDRAEIILRESLKHHWEPMLVDLYGKLISSRPERQFNVAESWLKRNGQCPLLLLALGRLALRNQLWGKAKDYLSQSLAIEEHSESYLEYGELLQYLGDKDAACQSFRKGLKMQADGSL